MEERLSPAPSDRKWKWIFLSVLTIVAGAVAGIAIYAWGWRDSTGDGGRDPAREKVLVEAIAFTLGAGGNYERLADGLWLFRFDDACFLVDVERFSYRVGGGYNGVLKKRC